MCWCDLPLLQVRVLLSRPSHRSGDYQLRGSAVRAYTPNNPVPRDESWYFFLVDPSNNAVWTWSKVRARGVCGVDTFCALACVAGMVAMYHRVCDSGLRFYCTAPHTTTPTGEGAGCFDMVLLLLLSSGGSRLQRPS